MKEPTIPTTISLEASRRRSKETVEGREEEHIEGFPRLSYIVGTGFYTGMILFDNFYQFLAIMLGSAGMIQGLLVSVRQLASAFLNPLWGYLSDRHDRRWLLFGGNVVLCVTSVIIPFSPNTIVVLFLCVFQTLFGTMVFINSWNAYLGDYTDNNTRGRMLGRINSLITWLGNIILIITTVVMDLLDPTMTDFTILIIPYFLSSIGFALSAITTVFLPCSKKKSDSKLNLKAFFALEEFPRPIIKFLIADFIFTLAWGAAWPLFPYITLDLANSWFEIGFLAFIMGGCIALGQQIGGRVVDIVGRRKVIIWSRLAIVVPPLLFGLAVVTNDIIWIFLSNIIAGLFLGASIIAVQSLILDTAPDDKKAYFLSIQTMVFGLASFIGASITGIVLQLVCGDNQPSLEIVAVMISIIGVIRFIFWFFYWIIEDPIQYSE